MGQRRNPAETFTRNLKMLLMETGMDLDTLVKKSGVSKRMIQYILSGEKKPTIERADAIAGAFKLDGWVMLMPDLRADLLKNGHLRELIKHYSEASEDGRNYICHVAEKEASYNIKP